MVARPGEHQPALISGELAPELWHRTDLKQYYSGAALLDGLEPLPQGGARLMPRSRHCGRVRKILTDLPAIPLSFTPGPHSSPAVIASWGFAQPTTINTLTVYNVSCSPPAALANALEWQYSIDNINWFVLGEAFAVTNFATVRSQALAPGAKVSVIQVRLMLVIAPGVPTTISFEGAAISDETVSQLSPVVRLRPFSVTTSFDYVTVLSHDVADIWRNGDYVASARTGFFYFWLGEMQIAQRIDTMLCFHRSNPPTRILRVDEKDWRVDRPVFTNIPLIDLGGNYIHTTDKWRLALTYPTGVNEGANLLVVFNCNGQDAVAVSTGAPDWNAFAAGVKVVLESLPDVEPGLIVTSGAGPGGSSTDIEFTGAGNAGRHFVMSARVVNSAQAAASMWNMQFGKPSGDPIMGAAGWPAAGCFYQDRLLLGGFAAREGAILASVIGEYFDLNTEIPAANAAILFAIDTQGAERIQRLVLAKHLVAFTSEAEYFMANRVFSRNEPPNIVESSRNGSGDVVPIIESEGSLLYVHKNKSLIYAAAHDAVNEKYVSSPISMLASHIITGIDDSARQRAQIAIDADRHFLVKNDGAMIVGIMLREQSVAAYVRWSTAGLVRAVCVDGANVPFVVVERFAGGILEQHLERLELGVLFDGQVDKVLSPAGQVVTGLEMHNGATVWAQADGFVLGPFTVAGGAITLPRVSTNVSVGRWTPPRAITLPLRREVAERTVLRRPARVHTVRMDLINTTSLAIGANGGAPEDVPLYRAGDPTDVPPAPFTGWISVTGLTGFTDQAQIEITQLRPGRLQWRSIVIEART